MRIFIIVVFLAYLILEYVNLKCNQRSKKVLFIIHLFLLLSLVLMAGYRDGFRYADYANYVSEFFNDSGQFEFSFYVLSRIATGIDHENYYVLFLLYALLGVSLKSIGIWRLSSFPYASMAVYVSYYYILHELIQIRVGVASAIGLIALREIYNKNLFRFLLLIALAACFHVSALFYILFYFLDCNSFYRLRWMLYGLVICVFSTIIFSYIFPYISFEFASDKLNYYIYMAEIGIIEKVPIAGRFYMIQYAICLIYVLLFRKLNLCDKRLFFLIKILLIGYCVRYAFYVFSPTMSIRLSDLCLISEIVLLPSYIYIFKQRIFGILFVFFIGSMNIIFSFYFSIFVPL